MQLFPPAPPLYMSVFLPVIVLCVCEGFTSILVSWV